MKCPLCSRESKYPDMCSLCHEEKWQRAKADRENKAASLTRGVFELMKKEGFIVKV